MIDGWTERLPSLYGMVCEACFHFGIHIIPYTRYNGNALALLHLIGGGGGVAYCKELLAESC
jgi:hypothetical protein